ncbi:unnamed protein product [Adineta ricciae]|uniref:PLAT domain-containing protein n=1 Tax=Adineta ricciae TaxID=249248 RepID=A0A815YXM4_ADIRI|nr:unnamed protein product [Adineta ricciae]
MLSLDSFFLSIIILLVDKRVEGTSINQPKLCPAATSSTIGSYPYAVFIDQNNKIYVTNQQMSSVQVWINDSSLPKTIAIRNNNYPISLFVTDDGTIYVDDNNNYVTSWLLNKTGNQSSLYTGETCYGLFIDKNNSLYCSLSDNHIVITRSLNRSDNQTAIVAGSNCFGFLGNSLYYPRGIIVDTNYSLCVADCQNHRVQLFRLGAGNTTTIAGWGPPVTITLYYPNKKDLEKFGVTPLPDNQLSDQYFYQILIFTGHQTYSGINYKAHFILAGDDDETQVRTLADPHRKILSLGSLNYIHIWHDNSGKGASAAWFLKYITVRDLQTLDKSYFICHRWLAVDRHTIAWRRVISGFRSFHDQVAAAKASVNTASLAFGPLHITPEQISTGIIVELLSILSWHRTQTVPSAAVSFTTGCKTQKWLTSLLAGFFSSIFLIQPAKIIGVAIIFALFIRNTNNDQQAFYEVRHLRQFFHSTKQVNNDYTQVSTPSRSILELATE